MEQSNVVEDERLYEERIQKMKVFVQNHMDTLVVNLYEFLDF